MSKPHGQPGIEMGPVRRGGATIKIGQVVVPTIAVAIVSLVLVVVCLAVAGALFWHPDSVAQNPGMDSAMPIPPGAYTMHAGETLTYQGPTSRLVLTWSGVGSQVKASGNCGGIDPVASRQLTCEGAPVVQVVGPYSGDLVLFSEMISIGRR